MINGRFIPIFVWKNTAIRFIEEDVRAVYNYYCLRVVCMKSEYLITQSWLCLLIRILATKSYANPSTSLHAVRQNFPSKSKCRAPYCIVGISCTIPYSGNLSQEKTFAIWYKNGISRRKLSWISRYTVYVIYLASVIFEQY